MDEKTLRKLLEGLPRMSGAYLMRDSRQRIIYVGKAKNLRSRVRSYFVGKGTDTRFFATRIRELVADIEVIVTSSEKEALLLESNLIKEHNPRFNIRLRDDKEYLSLRLDIKKQWPKLELVRRPNDDGALYFGPYHSAADARETLKLAARYFGLRSCADRQMRSRTRPCLQHQIRRCSGPCSLDVDWDEYMRQVGYLRLFLSGRRDQLIEELRCAMGEAAEELAYERAAALRDQIRAVDSALAPQTVTLRIRVNQDVVGLCRRGDQVQVAVLEVRGGRLTGCRDFHFTGQEFPDEELLSSFVIQRYDDAAIIPEEIVVSRRLSDAGALSEVLTERRGSRCRVFHPSRGARADQAEMADRNASQLLDAHMQDETAVDEQLGRIQKKLRLSRLPRRIECVDISHLGGSDTVGAISVVVDGSVRRGAGRTFRVRTPVEGDDYTAIAEVLTRRFKRAMEGQDGWEAPDLLIVDGGRGQLARARAVLVDLKLGSQPVVALAKERSGQLEDHGDRVYLPERKNPVPLKAGTSPLYLLALARDEAHRLAVRYQRKVRARRTLGSELDSIEGVGPKTRAELLSRLGSIKRIRRATVEELIKVKGVGPALAGKIKQALE